MANPQLETFLKQVKGDPALLQRFSACPHLNAIAALLNESRTLTKKGKAKWYASTIRSILSRRSALDATDGR